MPRFGERKPDAKKVILSPIRITPAQYNTLKARSEQTGQPVSDIIRNQINQLAADMEVAREIESRRAGRVRCTICGITYSATSLTTRNAPASRPAMASIPPSRQRPHQARHHWRYNQCR